MYLKTLRGRRTYVIAVVLASVIIVRRTTTSSSSSYSSFSPLKEQTVYALMNSNSRSALNDTYQCVTHVHAKMWVTVTHMER